MLAILIVDNNDSFTYNIVEMLRQTKLCSVDVCLLENIEGYDLGTYDGIILSPGPGLPIEKKGLFELIDKIQATKPILGVCLGHQAIAEYFGADIYRLNKIVHGEASTITIDKNLSIFKNLPVNIEVGRYHSWAVAENTLPVCFEIGAKTSGNTIMSLKHKTKNINTVQFHPESILTPYGKNILTNWLIYCVKGQ